MSTTEDRLTREANATVQKGAKVLTPPARTRPTTPAEQEAGTVQVWPHLVVIEFLAAIIFTINLVLLGTLVNGPLAELANPDRTPNPSKAPWYFLNLQELLLHMNPALAGVIVPTIALGLIAAIPYVDRTTRGLGVWFYSERGPKIIILTTVYTTAVCAFLIAIDRPVGNMKSIFTDLLEPLNLGAENLGIAIEVIVGWTIPTLSFIIFPVLLVVLLKVVFKGIDLSEIIIALFTGFVMVYAVLTFVGTAMRGTGMELYMPWAVPPIDEGPWSDH